MLDGIYFGLIWYIGCCIGSFLMVVGTRIPIYESIVRPRSQCSTCKKKLSPKELFPLFSYFLHRRRCHSCSAPISTLYPLIEFSAGCHYLFCFFFFRENQVYFITALLLVTFATIFIVSDCLYFLLPNSLMLLFFFASFLVRFSDFSSALIGGVSLMFLLFFVALLFPDGMGGGDIKLVGVIGWLLGIKLGLFSLIVACLLAFSYFSILFIWKKDAFSNRIPFAPFIFLGSIIVYFSNFWIL